MASNKSHTKHTIVIILVVSLIAAVIALSILGNNESVAKVLRTIILILVVLLLIYVIYEIYEYYERIRKNEPTLIASPVPAKTNKGYVFGPHLIRPSQIGTEYTYTFWVFVSDWNYKYGQVKHILNHGSDPSASKIGVNFEANPGIWFYPKNSSLMIRFDTHDKSTSYQYHAQSGLGGSAVPNTSTFDDTTLIGCQKQCSATKTCGGIQINKLTGQCILNDSSFPTPGELSPAKSCSNDSNCPGSDYYCAKTHAKTNGQCKFVYDSYSRADSVNPKDMNLDMLNPNSICDLVEIPIQRWVHVGVVLWNRTTDIYLNGKLARSCILKGVPKIPQQEPLHVCRDGGFNGAISQLRYFNRSLNAAEIYRLYSKGPLHWSLLKEFEDLFPKVTVSADVSYG